MSAQIQTLPYPRSRRFGFRVRWMAVVILLVVAAMAGSAWALLAASHTRAPATPAIKIHAPANPGPANQAPAQAPGSQGQPDPYRCGLTIGGGPC